MSRIRLRELILVGALSIGVSGVASADNLESRQLPDFSRISVRGAVPVSLRPGNENQARITTGNHVSTAAVVTQVDNDLLTIQLAPGAYTNPNIRVSVTYSALTMINAEAGAIIQTEQPIAGQTVTVNASSGAKLQIDLNAELVKAKAGGGARLTLTGRADALIASSSSGSTLEATQLNVSNIQGASSSGAQLHLHSDGQLSINATSGGTVTYTGKPKKLETQSTRGGRIFSLSP